MLQRRMESQKQRRHRRLQLDRSSCRQVNYLPGLLIVLLVLLQNFELHMCRQLTAAAAVHRRSSSSSSSSSSQLLQDNDMDMDMDMDTDTDIDTDTSDTDTKMPLLPALLKRSPEEIFSAPSDAPDMSYDEYPMVVPKRAALLLDRLMVALHHALENEREGHRIGEFYANKNLMHQKTTEYKNGLEQLQATQEGSNMPSNSHISHMYSDDDPGVLVDYDFKDLNQINRATGETLMAKSFQRRAGGINNPASAAPAAAAGMDAATSTSGSAKAAGAGPSARRIHHVANGGGRMYWRCYFNAISCF